MEEVLESRGSANARVRKARALCPRLAAQISESILHLDAAERAGVESRLHRGGRLRTGTLAPAAAATAAAAAAVFFLATDADGLGCAVATFVCCASVATTWARARMRSRRRAFQLRLEAWVREEGGRDLRERLDAGALSLAEVYERAGSTIFAALDEAFERYAGEVGAPEFRTDCEPFPEEERLIGRMREAAPTATFRVARLRTLFARGRGELALVGAERRVEGLGLVTCWYIASGRCSQVSNPPVSK